MATALIEDTIFPKTILKEFKRMAFIKSDYAFYELLQSFGFKQGYDIAKVWLEKNPTKTLVRVKILSGNNWGKGTWLIINEKYFYTIEDALGHLEGKTRVYKPKRKPELIRELTEPEIKNFLGLE